MFRKRRGVNYTLHNLWRVVGTCGEKRINTSMALDFLFIDILNTVMGCHQVSSRLITIGLRAVPFNITIVQAYAQTSDYNDNEIEQFYDQLLNVIDQTPKKDILVVQGDWNAKVGKDAYGNWQGICGPLCNDDTNERTQTSGVCQL